MKLFTYLLAGSLWIASAVFVQAQTPVTLTQNNFPATPSAVEYYLPNYQVVVPIPQAGANQVWDYSALAPDSDKLAIRYAIAAATPSFPTATRTYNPESSYTRNVVSPYRIPYSQTRYEALTASGLQELGFSMAMERRQLYQTGNPTDSLVIPAQFVAHPASYRMKFPLTSGSTANRASYRTAFEAFITWSQLGLNRAPLRIVIRVQQADSIVGWGTMRIPAAAGPSAPARVLMQRSLYEEVDSVYLGDQPAPATMLAMLGWPQGARTGWYADKFFRENSSQPLLTFYYADATYQTLRNWGAWYSAEPNVVTSTRTSLVNQPSALVAYPNPVTDGQLTITIKEGNQRAIRLTVRDLLGRQVATAAATTGEPSEVLRDLSAGTYLVEVQMLNGARATLKVNVQ